MSDLPSRGRHKKLEQWLKTELLAAEHNLHQATPAKEGEALQRYQEAIFRLSRLVLDDELPRDASPSWDVQKNTERPMLREGETDAM